MQLDKKTFKHLITWMAAIIIILGILILVIKFVPGIPFISGGEPVIIPEEIEDNGPWGTKMFTWTYLEASNTITVTITNETYNQFNTAFGGTNIPDDLLNYVIISGDNNTISTITSQLSGIAANNGYDSKETMGLVLSFVESINYETDSETGHAEAYPRTPVVTLAEQTGDSGDHTILAAALLKKMGYGYALAYYPATYDRLTIIPDALALGVIGGDKEEGPVYLVETTVPKTNITFQPDKSSIYPITGTTYTDTPMDSGNAKGYYTGTGYWTEGNLSGSLGTAVYTPSTGMFTAEFIPTIPAEYGTPAIYTIENASWVLPISIIWTVDTETKGTPVAAYNGLTPIILNDDALWKGNEAVDESSETLHLESVLNIPTSGGDIDNNYEVWRDATKTYYESTWYPSGVTWTENDKWRLYEHFLTINEIPGTLYTPWGTAEQIVQVPWRIAYVVSNIDKDNLKGMTPYSDVRIAVYKINDDGTLTLTDITGWQGTSDADATDHTGIYSPGKYAIGVFVRNADISIDIEYSGKNSDIIYEGGI